ncbi:cell cycle checkpoint protein rad17 [Pseudohyphozyma bogoriensis]|nr:cell cycle checkpoint protein rad17 [Pseudohyphozyma bogoriensis]
MSTMSYEDDFALGFLPPTSSFFDPPPPSSTSTHSHARRSQSQACSECSSSSSSRPRLVPVPIVAPLLDQDEVEWDEHLKFVEQRKAAEKEFLALKEAFTISSPEPSDLVTHRLEQRDAAVGKLARRWAEEDQKERDRAGGKKPSMRGKYKRKSKAAVKVEEQEQEREGDAGTSSTSENTPTPNEEASTSTAATTPEAGEGAMEVDDDVLARSHSTKQHGKEGGRSSTISPPGPTISLPPLSDFAPPSRQDPAVATTLPSLSATTFTAQASPPPPPPPAIEHRYITQVNPDDFLANLPYPDPRASASHSRDGTVGGQQPQYSISSFLTKLGPPPIPSTSTSTTPSPTRLKPIQKSIIKTEPQVGGGSDKGKGKEKAVVVEDEQVDAEEGLWIDRYAPTSRDELGVHPRKVTDVENWLGEAFNPRLAKYRRILVMSGPSGAAKTATLRILCEEEGIDVLEYRNGSNLSFGGGDFDRESMVQQFTNFLSRAGMAPALDFGPSPSSLNSPTTLSTPSTTRKRLILLEDLPNTSHYPTKLAFRSALAQYLASPRVTCPLVVIISEALARPGVEAESTGAEGRGESVDARSVCGVEVLDAPGCRHIQFNPVAVTIMKKTLLKVLDRVYSSSHLPPSSRPSTSTLELIIAHSNGDIRSAMMSLEFLATNPSAAVKGVTSLAAGGEGTKKGRKRKSDGEVKGKGASGEEVKKLLQFVTARESSLFIFHALGKVMYSKRWGISAEDDKKDLGRPGIEQERMYDRLPKHLRAEWNRKATKVNPDTLFAEAPVDSDVFLSYVHHNYTGFTNDIDECLGIMEGVSLSDGLMRLEGEDWLRRAQLTSQYSFAVSIRSTLINLPSPVPHRKQVLRKSELWDKLRLTRNNEDGIEEMFRSGAGVGVVPAWEGEDGRGGEKGGGGCQRSRRSLGTEVGPFLGVFQRGRGTRKNFWTELATFPPVLGSNMKAFVAGEALGEKEVDELSDQEGAGEEEEEEVPMEVEAREEELLYDPEDDIVDSD